MKRFSKEEVQQAVRERAYQHFKDDKPHTFIGDEVQRVTVRNLATGEELLYVNMVPSQAVMYAYFHSIGLNNTFEYSKLYEENLEKLIFGKHTVAVGDWCAMKGGGKIEN